jgi:hypothetical protein
MSARQQGGQLRAILLRKLRSSGLNEAMVNTLNGRGQYYTGKLSDAILRRDFSKDLSISYTTNKEFDVIENVSITFFNRLVRPLYAELIDSNLADDSFQELDVEASDIERWILAKVKNGTWKNKYGPNYVQSNNYSTRRERRDVNKGVRGGKSKTYVYPLVGAPKSKKARASLAFLIARSINQNQSLKNRSPYFASGNIVAEFALLSALEEFNELWLQDIGVASINKVISILG